MPVPTYDKFMEPILRYLAGHPEGVSARDAHETAAAALGLSDADKQELVPSGTQTVYKNRAGWAHDRLKRAGLSMSTRRGFWKLTPQGIDFATCGQSAPVNHEARSSAETQLLPPASILLPEASRPVREIVLSG